MKTSTPYWRPLSLAMSGRIECVIGGTSVGVETMKVAWFQVVASIQSQLLAAKLVKDWSIQNF